MRDRPIAYLFGLFLKLLGALFILAVTIFTIRTYFMEYGYNQPFYKIYYLTKKAERGDIEAAMKLQLHYESRNNMDNALFWLRKRAAFGDKDAQRSLFHWLEERGDKNTQAEGLKWLFKAAENGDEIAQFELSDLYFEGRGVDKNIVEGEKWLRRSAASKFAPAMTTLSGLILAKSRDRKSLVEAYAWARLALDQVHPESLVAADARRQLEMTKKGAHDVGVSEAELEAEVKKLAQHVQGTSVGKR